MEKESDFLNWLYSRLVDVHGENENYDYMIRFKKIIKVFRQGEAYAGIIISSLENTEKGGE